MRQYNREINTVRNPDVRRANRTELPKARDIPQRNNVRDVGRSKADVPGRTVDYSRPGWKKGIRDEVWNKAKDTHGRVRDPVTGKYMSKDKPWDMGHKPGHEFSKHQKSAQERGISREQFIKEYNNPDNLRPELPSSNRSHRGENKTGEYFGT